MKKLRIIASALLIAISLSAVNVTALAATNTSKETSSSQTTTQKATTPKKKPSTATILKAVYSPKDEFKRLEKQKKADIMTLYDIKSTSFLKSYAVYITPIMPGGREVALFEVKDKKDIKKAQAAAKYRQSALKESAWYPSEKDNADNSQIITQGNYVLFVADFEADKIVKDFKAYYKKNLK